MSAVTPRAHGRRLGRASPCAPDPKEATVPPTLDGLEVIELSLGGEPALDTGTFHQVHRRPNKPSSISSSRRACERLVHDVCI
jgi:hypothetical protein